MQRALSDEPIHSSLSKAEIFLQCAAALGVLSQSMKNEINPAKADSLRAQAIQYLVNAIEAGYDNIEYLKSDPDFEWLHDTTAMDDI